MVKTNDGNAPGAKSFLEEISERLAALTPEQFTTPNNPLKRSFVPVGTANENIKRLFTLMDQAGEEVHALMKKGERFFRKIETLAPKDGDALVLLKNFIDSGITKAEVEELQALQNKVNNKKKFHEVVKTIFWLEVRRQYPELADKDEIGIFSDWSLGWTKDQERPSLEGLGLGGLGDLFRNRATTH